MTARGIDVPGVTHVVQTGMPSSVEQCACFNRFMNRIMRLFVWIDIHRLGRTARAGQTGKGLLVLAPYEEFFLRSKGMQGLSLEPWQDAATGA